MSHKEIILADEMRRLRQSMRTKEGDSPTQESSTVKLIKMENETRTTSFTPRDTSKTNTDGSILSLPIKGEGRLDSLIVKADSASFSVEFIIDGTEIFDIPYDEMNNISPELTRASAYETNGVYTINIDSYPFSEVVNARITPQEEVTFSLIRVEVEINNVLE